MRILVINTIVLLLFPLLGWSTFLPESIDLSSISEDRDGIIVLEGKYQNRNIYITNAISELGVGFCAYEIRVNGELITDEINSSAFEIDLSHYELKTGDDVLIEIRHKSGCTPKVINPGGLKPTPTFETKEITLSEDGFLEWITEGEFGSLPYTIEQYKWNKWVPIGEVQGKGSPGINNYAFHVDFVSGENKIRVVQYGDLKTKKSKSVTYIADKPAPTFIYNKKTQMVVFSEETSYEVFDKYGRLLKRGYGDELDVAELPKDEYWLSFDNLSEKLVKK